MSIQFPTKSTLSDTYPQPTPPSNTSSSITGAVQQILTSQNIASKQVGNIMQNKNISYIASKPESRADAKMQQSLSLLNVNFIEAFKILVEAARTNKQALFILGLVLLEKDYPYLSKIIARIQACTDPEGYFIIGYINERQGDIDEAKKYYLASKVCDFNPENKYECTRLYNDIFRKEAEKTQISIQEPEISLENISTFTALTRSELTFSISSFISFIYSKPECKSCLSVLQNLLNSGELDNFIDQQQELINSNIQVLFFITLILHLNNHARLTEYLEKIEMLDNSEGLYLIGCIYEIRNMESYAEIYYNTSYYKGFNAKKFYQFSRLYEKVIEPYEKGDFKTFAEELTISQTKSTLYKASQTSTSLQIQSYANPTLLQNAQPQAVQIPPSVTSPSHQTNLDQNTSSESQPADVAASTPIEDSLETELYNSAIGLHDSRQYKYFLKTVDAFIKLPDINREKLITCFALLINLKDFVVPALIEQFVSKLKTLRDAESDYLSGVGNEYLLRVEEAKTCYLHSMARGCNARGGHPKLGPCSQLYLDTYNDELKKIFTLLPAQVNVAPAPSNTPSRHGRGTSRRGRGRKRKSPES